VEIVNLGFQRRRTGDFWLLGIAVVAMFMMFTVWLNRGSVKASGYCGRYARLVAGAEFDAARSAPDIRYVLQVRGLVGVEVQHDASARG